MSNDDKKIALALTAELVIPSVKYTIVQSIPGLYLYNSIANIIVYILMGIILLLTVNVVFKRKAKTLLSIFLLLTIFILLNILIFPENRDNIYDKILRIYTISYVSLILSLSLYNFKVFLDYLYKASFVIISFCFFMLVNTFVFGAVGIADSEYNMSLSYYCLIPTITMLYKFLENKRNFSALIFFGIGIFVIIVMGSRGPLLGIMLFFLIYNIKTITSFIKLLKLIITYSFLFGIFVIYSDKLANWLYNVLLEYNIQSRTLYFFINNKLYNPTQRDFIAKEIIQKINEKPLLGSGFLSDLTPHNIILESWLFFGVIVGSILIIMLFLLTINGLLYSRDTYLSITILIFFSYAIPDALLNLTVWGKDIFWIYLGFCLRAQAIASNKDLAGLENYGIAKTS